MSSLLSAHHLSLRTPDHQLLLDDFSLSFSSGVSAIVGPNGVGKSTLLSVLAGKAAPHAGTVSGTGRVGWLAQLGAEAAGTLRDGLGVADGLARLDRIEAGAGDEADFVQADWMLPTSVETALERFGLDGFSLDHPLEALSGGQRARVSLASAWLSKPDILLMDEPTNNLDRDGRTAVCQLIHDWSGVIVIVSHDRALLEQVDRIIALEGPGWSVFGGGWSAYVEARDAARARAETAHARAEADARRVKRDAQEAEARLARRARQGRAQRADGSNAKVLLDAKKARSEATSSRLSGLAEHRQAEAHSRLEAAEAERHRGPRLSVKAVASDTTNRTVLRFVDVSLSYGDTPVLTELSFELGGGSRLAVEGPNGAGKSTVLKLALGTLTPTSGDVYRTQGRIARLDQTVSDLDPELSVVEALMARDPGLDRNAAYAALAQFDLRNKEADKPVRVLSGGERLRAGLAGVLGGEPPELILLDEPTNHLDLDAIEALEGALRNYSGALVAVSHDPAFLQAIGIDQRLSLNGS